MHSNDREEIVGAFDALDAALTRTLELSCDVLNTPECLAMLQRCETVRRKLPALEHPLINQLAERADPTELGGKLSFALAERLRITRADASRRIGEAAELGPRRALTGQLLAPVLAATAAAQRAGRLGTGHVAAIRGFWHPLPEFVDIETREKAEAQLACQGGEYRPDQLGKLADKLIDCLNPDGDFTDTERARRRGITIGKQDIDGMTPITGYLTPEARATIDAVLAKLAAPGMCNPDDATRCLGGTATQAAVDNDTRSAGQRNHDGLNAALRAMLASGDLGQHNGLPTSIIVSTTLAELESKCGKALTAGGALLPMSDVIRLASHAHHYLCIFDQGKTIGLYHTRRIASRGQRIVLHAKDRGCSFPNCDVPSYLTEAHHVTGFAKTKDTHIDDLTLCCGPHHKLTEQGWTTRKNLKGDTEWIAPAHLDSRVFRNQRRTNRFHHPEKLLCDDEDGP